MTALFFLLLGGILTGGFYLIRYELRRRRRALATLERLGERLAILNERRLW